MAQTQHNHGANAWRKRQSGFDIDKKQGKTDLESSASETGSSEELDPVEKICPCNKHDCWRKTCETSGLCKGFGGLGIHAIADKNRGPMFKVMMILNVITLALCVVTCFSTSKTAAMVKNVPLSWNGKSQDPNGTAFSIYLGTSAVVIDKHVVTGSDLNAYGWSEVCNMALPLPRNASDRLDENKTDARHKQWQTKCNKCKDSSDGYASSLIMGVFSQLGVINFDYQRMYAHSDSNCAKMTAFITTLIALGTNLPALTNYNSDCVTMMNDFWELEPHMESGPAMSILWATAMVAILDIIVHSLVPTPPGRRGKDIDGYC